MLSVAPNETVRDVKTKLQAQTHVAVDNQKIMGWLPKGKIPEDKVRIHKQNIYIMKIHQSTTKTEYHIKIT